MMKTACAKSDYMSKHPRKKLKMKRKMNQGKKKMKVPKVTQKNKELTIPKKSTKKYFRKPKLDHLVENHWLH